MGKFLETEGTDKPEKTFEKGHFLEKQRRHYV